MREVGGGGGVSRMNLPKHGAGKIWRIKLATNGTLLCQVWLVMTTKHSQ